MNVTSSPSPSATISCGLLGPNERTGQDQIEYADPFPMDLGNLLHLFFAFFGQRPIAIFLVPGRSSFNSDAMTENVDFHYLFFSDFLSVKSDLSHRAHGVFDSAEILPPAFFRFHVEAVDLFLQLRQHGIDVSGARGF